MIPRREIFFIPGWFNILVKNLFSKNDSNLISEFESQFADYIDTQHAVVMPSARYGFYLILKYLICEYNIKNIIIPAYSDDSIIETLNKFNLSIIPIDVDRNTMNIDIDKLNHTIVTQKIDAILVTHLFGNPMVMDDIPENIIIIEDCAHALGAEINNKKTGSFGLAGFFSFMITKPFNMFGGGMVTTNNAELNNFLKQEIKNIPVLPKITLLKKLVPAYILHLLTNRYIFTYTAGLFLRLLRLINFDEKKLYNTIFRKKLSSRGNLYIPNNIQIQLGIKLLKYFEKIIDVRNRNIYKLDRIFSGNVPIIQYNKTVKISGYFYVICVNNIDWVRKQLLSIGLDTGTQLMRNIGNMIDKKDYKNTEYLIKHSLQIPVHLPISDRILNKLCTTDYSKDAD